MKSSEHKKTQFLCDLFIEYLLQTGIKVLYYRYKESEDYMLSEKSIKWFYNQSKSRDENSEETKSWGKVSETN